MLFLLFATLAFAHPGHPGHHNDVLTQAAKMEAAAPDQNTIYHEIQSRYESEINPIFDSKCAACHSALSPSPWYASIPGLHWLIEGDREKAKEHLEISKGFPFAGHGSPEEDLQAITDSIVKESMPTPLYLLVHPTAILTEREKVKILSWTNDSLAKLSRLKH